MQQCKFQMLFRLLTCSLSLFVLSRLGVRFDHDFFESECSEPSRKLVEDYRDKVFFDSNGALGADLSKFNLGFWSGRRHSGSQRG